MGDLSLILDIFKKSQGAKHQAGKPGIRLSASEPAAGGYARGAMGTMGSRTFQGRDSDAGSRKDHEMMNSPVFKAFMNKQLIQTPITNWLIGNGASTA